jgi:hypothetical protein
MNCKKETGRFYDFSPDCEHCQHETEALLANIDTRRNTQILSDNLFTLREMIQF